MVLRDAQAIHPPLTALTLPVELECLGLPAAERSVRGATLAVAHCCAMHVVLPFTPLFRSSIDHVLESLKVRAHQPTSARFANRDSCSRDRNLTPVYMAEGSTSQRSPRT